MSITELAEATQSSEGSIVGLCRRFGAAGFQEVKILLARDLVKPVQFIQEDLQEGDTDERVCDIIFQAHATTLTETRKLLSVKSISTAVEILQKAERIDVYGIGSSTPIAIDLAFRLLQMGLPATAFIDPHIQVVNASRSSNRVAAITISHSGSTQETITATRLAKEAGARVIGITRLGKSPLQRYCDVVLCTVANETRYRPEAMSSRVAQLAIIDALVSCCALANPKKAIASLQKSSQVLAEKRI